MRLISAVAVAVLAVAVCAVSPLVAEEPFGRLPLAFEENRGQFDSRVDFLARSRGYNAMVTPSGVILDVPRHASLRIHLAGSNPDAHPEALQPLPGHANYYMLGPNGVADRRENVPTWSRVRYANAYPGIDVVYYGTERRLDYDFVVSPGADPRMIRLHIDGADRLRIDRSGDLLITTGGLTVRQLRPVMYQELNGIRRSITGRYVRAGRHGVTFAVGSYDRTKPLVIDPVVLTWESFVGGTSSDFFEGIAVDGTGATYVTGQTQSSDYPAAGFGSDFQTGDYALIISKVNATGTVVLYSTYYHVDGYYNIGRDIKVDAAGEAYVTGTYQSNVVAIRLHAAGTSKYGGLLGSGDGHGIAIDSAGNAYVTGRAKSPFPTTPGAFQTVYGGSFDDAFISKINTNVAPNISVIYSTFLGGSSGEKGDGIAVDSAGNAYVAGTTSSTNFPRTTSGYQQTHGGGSDDVFVTKLNASGSALLYSTFLGGSFFDSASGIAVDAANNVYAGGYTKGSFPTTAGTVQPSWNIGNCSTTTYDACPDGWVAKLNPSAASAQGSLVWSTYFGTTSSDWVTDLQIDTTGSVYVAGRTFSPAFPQVDPIGGITSGSGFVARLSATGSSILFSSYYYDMPVALARLGSTGALFLAGSSYYPGNQDGFIAKISGLPADASSPPSITTQPQSSTIAPGQTATLSVTATGTAPLSYQWYVGNSGVVTSPIAGATSSSYTTPSLTSTTRYWVRVSNSASYADSATATITVSFTDQPLTVNVTLVRAVHIRELRTRVDTVRTRRGLLAYSWTDPTLTAGVTMVRAVHITELRTALAQAYTASSLTAPSYTDPALAGVTIKAVHIEQLRSAVAAIE